MALFSERYGYLKPREVIIREQITEPVQNSIYNWYNILKDTNCRAVYPINFNELEREIWMYFLNKRMDDFPYRQLIFQGYILNEDNEWYKKLDLIEFTCQNIVRRNPKANLQTKFLNSEFERHNFAYRIVDCRFVEITSDEEIKSVEDAIGSSIDGVRIHLQTALKHLSASQEVPDYRNSIKESISAVECLCRNITGENTLGKALQQLESKGVSINSTLKSAFEKLYGYTNNADTGVRHALMDDANAPTSAEALYMLVTCSAFINYVNTKMQQTNG